MALNADALSTLATLKTELGISGSSEDTRLERLIHSASSWIENTTGRKFKLRDYNGEEDTHDATEVPDEAKWLFSGDTLDHGGQTLIRNFRGVVYVPNYPIVGDVTLESLTNRVNDTWSEELEEDRDFIINRETGEIILLSGCFESGVYNYRLTYSAGYETIPYALEQLVIEFCRFVWDGHHKLKSERTGNWTREFRNLAEDEIIRSSLAQFQKPVV